MLTPHFQYSMKPIPYGRQDITDEDIENISKYKKQIKYAKMWQYKKWKNRFSPSQSNQKNN